MAQRRTLVQFIVIIFIIMGPIICGCIGYNQATGNIVNISPVSNITIIKPTIIPSPTFIDAWPQPLSFNAFNAQYPPFNIIYLYSWRYRFADEDCKDDFVFYRDGSFLKYVTLPDRKQATYNGTWIKTSEDANICNFELNFYNQSGGNKIIATFNRVYVPKGDGNDLDYIELLIYGKTYLLNHWIES